MIGDFFTDLVHGPPDAHTDTSDGLTPFDGSTAVATDPPCTAVDQASVPVLTDGPAVATHDPADVVRGVGTPDADAEHWHSQGSAQACAVASQGSIIESLTGIPFDLHAAEQWLSGQGWYDPATGTRPEDLTRLFDAYGVPTTSGSTTVTGLWDALAAGEKVMVTLDANEIWHPQHDPATGAPVESLQPAGHAVWLTGIEQNSHGEWQVVLNDSAHENGRAETVALADFVNAWDDYGNHAVVAGSSATSPAVPAFPQTGVRA